MVSAYVNARDRGWNPVSLGRARWVPGVYEDTIRFAASVESNLSDKAREKARRSGGR